jgi:hypothetical protein
MCMRVRVCAVGPQRLRIPEHVRAHAQLIETSHDKSHANLV